MLQMVMINLRQDFKTRLVSMIEDFTGLVNVVKSNFKALGDNLVVLKMAMNALSRQIECGAPKIKVSESKPFNGS